MTMTDNNPFTGGQVLLKEYKSFIDKVSRDTAYSFWKVDEEDVQQEISLFLWQKESDFFDQGRSPAYIKACIRNVATNYAYKQRNQTLLESDKFYYSADEVKALLPAFFGSDWTQAPVPQGAETMTKNDNVEIMCDFSLAFDKLKEPQKDILRRKYEADEDLLDDKERKALSRANRRFLTILNDNSDIKARNFQGPGSRKAMTNASGLSKTRGAYDV